MRAFQKFTGLLSSTTAKVLVEKPKCGTRIFLVAVLALLISCQATAAEPAENSKLQQGVEAFSRAEYSVAHSILQELESELESSAEFQYHYGISLLMIGETRDARNAMEQAIELEPDSAEYHYAMARIHGVRARENAFRAPMIAGSYRRELRRATELDPQHVGATRALTSFLLDFPSILGGDKEEGRMLLSKLRELDEAAAMLEEALIENDRNFDLAEELLIGAINMPDSSVGRQARISLGKLYIIHEQYDKAVPYLHESLDMPWIWSETSARNEGHIHLAVCYYFLGDEENFRKQALAAEETGLTRRDREAVESWFDYWGIE